MNEEQTDILDEVHRLITALESHPDTVVGEQVAALLEGIDTVHRTALTHLVNAIHGMAGEAFMNRLTADPATRLLFMSYDLLAVDRRIQAEEALDAVRGHLHSRGIDVEITEVVGGVIYVRLHGLAAARVAEEAVRHDLEAALKEGLLGFQELVLRDRQTDVRSPLVQLGGLRRPYRPVYRTAFGAAELASGEIRAVEMEGQSILLSNVEGEFYALANHCGESPLPLDYSELQGAELRCSWHGCLYDVRTGARLDGGPDRIAVFPVAIENGEVRVAIGTEPMVS